MLHILANHAKRSRRSTASWSSAAPGLCALSPDERATLANMATECSAKAGVVRGRRRDAARGSPRAGPGVDRRRAAREGRRARSRRAATPAACTASISSTIRPMVATPGDPAKGIPSRSRPTARYVAEIGDVHDRHRLRRLVHRRQRRRHRHVRARDGGGARSAGKRVADGVDFYIQFGSQAPSRTTRASRATSRSSQQTGVKVITPGCGACIGCGPGVSVDAEAGLGLGDQPQLSRAAPGPASCTWRRRSTSPPRRSPARSSPTKRACSALRKSGKYPSVLHSKERYEMARSLPREIWIVGAKRTAFGTFGGALKDLTATDLAVDAAKAALAQAGVDPSDVEHVDLRQRAADLRRRDLPARATSACGPALPIATAGAHRQPPLRLGLPGDHQRRRADPARRGGGGARRRHREHVAGAARPPRRALGPAVRQGAEARGLALGRAHRQLHRHADGHDRREPRRASTSITRAGVRRVRAALASSAGRRRNEGGPLQGRDRARRDQVEEGPGRSSPSTSTRARRRRSRRSPSSPPVFKKDGVVTAGNASGICDGAAALVLCTQGGAAARTAGSRSRAHAVGRAGCDPKIMGIGPAPAIRTRLDARGAQARATSISSR